MRYTIVDYTHDFLKARLNSGCRCIDATAGKGNDTKFLCEIAGDEGKVIAFDIQDEAINITNELLEKNGLASIGKAIKDSHENMDKYVEEGSLDAIVFNLGYLPGGDHSIATRAESTIKAIEKGFKLLKVGGMMSICIYSGGDSGFDEKDAVLRYLQGIDNKKYTVIKNQFYNKPNNPPIPVFIIKTQN
ncbi:MAG: class I SAM-dependent methyltransferase [Clostridiaceae bacterium]|nr:class I SAM-dependent methyltransferase [Clostridiaceae bacterium]